MSENNALKDTKEKKFNEESRGDVRKVQEINLLIFMKPPLPNEGSGE